MKKMYLESNNGGYGILVTGGERWYYWDESQLPVTLNGKDEDGRLDDNENVKIILKAIESGDMYDVDDWLDEFSNEELEPHYISAYDGLDIEGIDNLENYKTDLYSGDRHPLGHDTTSWIEIKGSTNEERYGDDMIFAEDINSDTEYLPICERDNGRK